MKNNVYISLKIVQPTDGRKFFPNHISDEALISTLYCNI